MPIGFGGGSAFNGGTITKSLTVRPATGIGLDVEAPGDNTAAQLENAAVASDYASTFVVATADTFLMELWSDGQSDFIMTQSDTNGFRIIDANQASRPRLRVTPSAFIIHVAAAPADADLNAGDCALWFDPTNGAAALNIKAKQADGTVKTATLPVA